MEATDLIRRSQMGDKAAREQMIEENLGLAHHIVRRFAARGYELEDLFQIGSIGLMKAIDKFDLSYDVKFSTYAVPMITGEIKRFIRDDGLVKVSRSIKENSYKVNKAREELGHQLGREPTLYEVAAKAGLSTEDVVIAMEAGAEVESIYQSVFQSDDSEVYLLDKMASTGGSTSGFSCTAENGLGEDYEKNKLLDHMLLNQLMQELEETERKLIIMRYFEDRTQTDVAVKLGISQVQVSRLEKKILLRMRERILV